MWEVDPETKTKVHPSLSPIQPLLIAIPAARNITKTPREHDLHRLLRPFPTMGLSKVRHLYLLDMRWPAPRSRSAHLLCTVNTDGLIQAR